MKIAVLSYSNSGNNDRFAGRVAELLCAEQYRVSSMEPFSYGAVIRDVLLNRVPKTDFTPERLPAFDCVLFFAPVWMGAIAAPLRGCLRWLRQHPSPYAFFSISGGALGENPKLAAELKRRTHTAPLLVLDQQIRDLLPADPPPTSADTSAYSLSEADCDRLAQRALAELRTILPAAFPA